MLTRSFSLLALLAACAQPGGAVPEVAGLKSQAAKAVCRENTAGCQRAIRLDAPEPAAVIGVEYAYGPSADQNLRLALAPCPAAPLVVFVHGGGWTVGDKDSGAGGKAAFYNARGYHFATVNYRLHPKATVEQAAGDVATAIAWLQAERPGAVRGALLQGHSAGAHLAALVALDPRYLEGAGLTPRAIRAVSLLDGAGYEIGAQIRSGGNADLYRAVFGDDPDRWAALSPLTYAADNPAGAEFVVHHLAERRASTWQSRALVQALTDGGAAATAIPVQGRTHASLNRRFGEAGDPVADQVASVFARAAPPCAPRAPA